MYKERKTSIFRKILVLSKKYSIKKKINKSLVSDCQYKSFNLVKIIDYAIHLLHQEMHVVPKVDWSLCGKCLFFQVLSFQQGIGLVTLQ